MMRKVIVFVLVFILVIFIGSKVYADEFSFSYGLGAGESAKNSISETKVAEFSYREYLYLPFYLAYEVGGWLDNAGNGRLSSQFMSFGPGYLVDLNWLEIRNSYGVSYITDPDIYLGGPFQFHGELYLGFRDKLGDGIGIKYNHFSSAGIYQPNTGRDFVLLELSTKW